MRRFPSVALLIGICVLSGCSRKEQPDASKSDAAPSYFKVDAATAGVLHGSVRFTGKKPVRKAIDMSGDPACMEAHPGRSFEEAVVVSSKGALANVFIYIKKGLEGITFEVPSAPVEIDQHDCWFHPRVLAIQTGQTLRVINSDPVTHNIHPLAQVNREWNHSQGQGDAPLARKFVKPEVMIRVKCNIHSWMHAFIGVVDHPYSAVTGPDGTFEMPNIPPGEYVVEAWHETLGTQEQKITVSAGGKVDTSFTFKGE